MMTNATKIVDKSLMKKIIYTKSELLAMFEEVQSVMEWSRDKACEEAGIKSQTAKDWYRKDRDNQIGYPEAISILNLHERIIEEKIPSGFLAIHKQLDSAIEYWFNEKDIILAHTLACAAYESIFLIIKERKIEFSLQKQDNYKSNINDITVEGLIYFSIVGLKLIEEKFTEKELLFCLWLSIHKPHLFTKDARIFTNSISKIKDNKISRTDFFCKFTGRINA